MTTHRAWMPWLWASGLIASIVVLVFAWALAWGGPRWPAPMAAINDPFAAVDVADLPEVRTYRGEDGQPLAYRRYQAVGTPTGSVTLVHGSSASSESMHALAKALAAAGFAVYALDVRGHGASGPHGHIGHIGQLESDLVAFVRQVRPSPPATLAGFSAGGGLVLRFAGSADQSLFGSYLLMSPFLGQDAPNQRPGSGGWVNVGVPRVVALSLLERLGLHAFGGLWVSRFALNDWGRAHLTPQYDFNLAMNFRPEADYQANLRRVRQPCAVMAGTADEAFRTEQLPAVVRAAGQSWPVELLPGVGHVQLTLAPAAQHEVVQQVLRLQQAR